MKLLIVCQALDTTHPTVGFFHRWVEEFAKHAESVIVIASSVGGHHLPENVTVYSLGKERGVSGFVRIFNFYKLIFSVRKQYDSVFVHMIPEFVLAGGVVWKLFGKRIGLWYVHGTVSWRLRVAALFTNEIFTTSPESCKLRSSKVHTLGHGIDGEALQPDKTDSVPRIVTVGRISASKNLDTILDAFSILKKRGAEFEAHIVGGPAVSADSAYARVIEDRARMLGVAYHGPLPHHEAMHVLKGASLFISASKTGSVDKAVLEASALGVVPVFSHEAFAGALDTVGLKVDGDPRSYAGIMQFLLDHPDVLKKYGQEVRKVVLTKHSLQRLIPRIMALYERP